MSPPTLNLDLRNKQQRNAFGGKNYICLKVINDKTTKSTRALGRCTLRGERLPSARPATYSAHTWYKHQAAYSMPAPNTYWTTDPVPEFVYFIGVRLLRCWLLQPHTAAVEVPNVPTWTMTRPPELWAAIAMLSWSQTIGSCSIEMFPDVRARKSSRTA